MKNKLFICFFFLVIYTSYSQDERDVINQIDSINALALNHYNKSDLMKSIRVFNDAIKLSDSIDDSYGNAVANFTLGRIYSSMREFDDAERSFKNMLIASLEIDDNYLIANSYLNLGKISKEKKQFIEVIPFFHKALQFAENDEVLDQNNQNNQQSVLFDIRMNLTDFYLDVNDPDKALLYLLRTENNLDKIPFSSYNEAGISFMYGRYFNQKESYFKAKNKFDVAIGYLEDDEKSEELNYIQLIAEIYKDLAFTLEKLENNKEAYAILLKHNIAREKIINEEKVKQGNIAKSKFYITEHKRIAQIATRERLLQEKVTNKMQKINLFIVLGVLLLLVSMVMLYKNYLSKRELSKILESRNKQLEIAKDEAEKSSQLKTNFISNVTHELRTPLYGVVGLTSLLLKNNNLSERDNKFLKSLKFSGDYLLNLVNDILQMGKIESQKIDLQIATVNPKILLENIIDSFEYRILENNNEIHFSIDDNIPEFVKCDNVRLSQILINLIGNSIKFTKNGKIWLSIEVLDFIDESVNLRFIVKDNGPGIPKEKHEKIFENFSQLNEKNNVNYQGTGLGLSIAKNLVELFDSEIKLVSNVGEGAEFSFDVKFEIDNKVQLKDLDKKDEGKATEIHDKFMILVAEDNKINQIVTQNVLEKGNFECHVVENGLEAFNAVKENNIYDLILMDLNMPVMNGEEATLEIRKINVNIPIIALTAAEIEEVKNDFSQSGFNDAITKPFDNFELYQKIITCIQESKKNISNDGKLFKVS